MVETTTIKFLCSYGGKILPRYTDGKLRYVGGETRVLAVDRSLSFAEVLMKLEDLCGSSVSLRCKLPNEDLDALISITSDEDLVNLIEEYDRASKATSSNLKIRAFLFPPKKSIKKISTPPSSTTSSVGDDDTRKYYYSSSSSAVGSRGTTSPTKPLLHHHHCSCVHQISKPVSYYENSSASTNQIFYYVPQGNPRKFYLVNNCNY